MYFHFEKGGHFCPYLCDGENHGPQDKGSHKAALLYEGSIIASIIYISPIGKKPEMTRDTIAAILIIPTDIPLQLEMPWHTPARSPHRLLFNRGLSQ